MTVTADPLPTDWRKVRHGRHCPCSACVRQDWTLAYLAPCDYHGVQCAYTPVAVTADPLEVLRALVRGTHPADDRHCRNCGSAAHTFCNR